MFLAAIAHYYSFSHLPFADAAAQRGDCCSTFISMWDVRDVRDDVIDHARYIGMLLVLMLVLLYALFSLFFCIHQCRFVFPCQGVCSNRFIAVTQRNCNFCTTGCFWIQGLPPEIGHKSENWA